MLASCGLAASSPAGENSCCEDGKPHGLTMQYTGDDCNATSHGQDADKVSCDGDPVFSPLVHIIANDKSNPNDGRIWFDGPVELGAAYDIDAANAGESKPKSKTYIHVFDLSDNLLQPLSFTPHARSR